MKALVFLFTLCSTLSFAQTPAENVVVGEWYSCWRGGVSLPSDLILTKKSFPEYSSGCVKDHCSYLLIRFESIPELRAAVVTRYIGCKNDMTAQKEEHTGWTWSLSEDGRTLFLVSDDKKQYQFAIEKSTSGVVSLRRV